MKKVRDFLPAMLSGVISIIASIIYSVFTKEPKLLTYLQILVGPMILFIIQGLNMTKIIRIPTLLSYLLMLHFFLALILGSAFNFYDRISCWDMILHGYFGFLFSFFVLCILLNYEKERMNPVLLFVIIFFTTMGAAGLWEIWEFTMDSLTNGDTQRIQESIAQGHTPVWDTMMDMIIAIPGILVFYACIGIDKLTGFRFMRYIYRDIKIENKEE